MLQVMLEKVKRICGEDIRVLSIVINGTAGGSVKFINSDGRVFKYTHVA